MWHTKVAKAPSEAADNISRSSFKEIPVTRNLLAKICCCHDSTTVINNSKSKDWSSKKSRKHQHALEEICPANCIVAALTEAHLRTTNPLTYNNEASFQSAIGLAYFYANLKYTVIKELPTGKGYADLVLIPYVPNIPAMIIELKNNKSAESAINQIKEKKYDDLLEHYRGDLLFVGINYDEKTKEHQCRIEELVS